MRHYILAAMLISLASLAHAETVTNDQLKTACHYAELKMSARHDIHLAMPLPVVDQDPEHFVHAVREAHGFDQALAAYQPGTIFIRQSFDPVTDMPQIVHECVHHFQAAFLIKYPCSNAKEREAYEIENEFIKETKSPMRAVPEEFIKRMSNCGGDK